MRKSYKRVAVSLTLLASVTLCVLAAAPGTASPPNILTSSAAVQGGIEVGRYQIVINPNVRADTTLLDTATGRTWKVVQYTDIKGQPTVWQIQDKVDDYDELRAWIRLQDANSD